MDILRWLSGPKRFLGVEAPTGSGKSLLAVLTAVMGNKRSAILTATKGLQTQMLKDFTMLTDIRGQNAYQCVVSEDPNVSVEDGSCHTGFFCAKKASGCYYYDALAAAKKDPILSTNYVYWISQLKYSDGLGHRDLLICDEAHMLFGALESFRSFKIQDAQINQYSFWNPPTADDPWEAWKEWAVRNKALLDGQLASLKEQVDPEVRPPPSLAREIRRVNALIHKCKSLTTSQGTWVVEREEGRYRGFSFSPVWPHHYACELYRQVPKVILMSATLTEKGMELAGVPKDDYDFISVLSSYPANLTPVSHINTIRVNFRSTVEDLKQWVARIDQIIDRRLDRKGIIFTVSYKRRDFLMTESRHGHLMVSHSTGDVIQAVDQFKRADAPRILVSPSVTSGYDFPGTDCDYIIIGKVPYPDTTPKVIKARQEEDKEWAGYTAMQTIVQSSGRGTRSPGDRCEVFITDDNWRWFWPKNKQYAPQWFHARVQSQSVGVTDPPF